MLRELDTYDWREAFEYSHRSQGSVPKKEYNLSSFAVEDVSELYGLDAGENDGDSWICYGKLNDGRYFSLNAWCDYTGWDCQSGGNSFIADSKKEIETFGLTEEYRERMGVVLPELP